MNSARKILILARDHAASFPIGAALRKCGWLVISAQDEATAMTMARQHRPDAVLLSSEFSAGRGLVVLKSLRSSVSTTMIPVVCMVGTEGPQRDLFGRAGAAEILEPAGDPAAIDAALRRCFGSAAVANMVPQAVLRDPARIRALLDSKLLDAPPDDNVDRVTRLAAKVMETPLARLSIVDTGRQFFASQVKLSGSPPVKRETPLSHSICQWVVGSREELIVGDARTHPVLSATPAVLEDGVAAYAGTPFTLDDQTILGSFCVVDTKPHAWTVAQIATLRDLALVVQAYAAWRVHPEKATMRTAGRALISAANVLMRGHRQYGNGDRQELCMIVDRISKHIVSMGQIEQQQLVHA